MKRILKHYRLPENIEALFMLTLGIVLQMTDGSPFTIRKRMMMVWETELPSEHFNPFVQHCIKMILTCIVVGRCLTTYLYVVSAMLVMFSILKDSFPRLMLLWLLVAGLKSVLMTFVEALTGVYVCSAFGKISKACVEFFVSKALEIVFAAYLWGNVLSIYYEMIRKETERKRQKDWKEPRPRARSLLDESTLQRTARLNSFEFKDVPQIILQMLRREEEMSQDSLLGPGMMLASVSNFGSFDDLKTSQSLGELGLLDLKAIKVMGIEEDDLAPPQEKALKFLKLNWNDVRKAQENRQTLDSDIFIINDEIRKRLTGSHPFLTKPKQTRPEVVLQGLQHHDLEQEIEKKERRKKSIELKFGFSLFSFIREKDELHMREEEQYSNMEAFEDDYDDDGDEEGTTPLFMSNIREEVAVNRIHLDFVSKKIKGNNYAKLYKEEYMSVIGPEVFDRATKLPKVTVPTTAKLGTRASVSLPAFLESNKRNRRRLFADESPSENEEKWESPATSFVSSDLSEDIKVINSYQLDDISVLIDEEKEIGNSNSFHSLTDDFGPENNFQVRSKGMACDDSGKAKGKQKESDIAKEKLKEKEQTVKKEEVKEKSYEVTSSEGRKKFPGLSWKLPSKSLESENLKNAPTTDVRRQKGKESEKLAKDKCTQQNQSCTTGETTPEIGCLTPHKRRIKIKRTGRRLGKISPDQKPSTDNTNDREGSCDRGAKNAKNRTKPSKPSCEKDVLPNDCEKFIKKQEDPCRYGKPKEEPREENAGFGCNDREKVRNGKKKQAYLASKLLQQPLVDLIKTYYSLKRKSQTSDHSIKNSKTKRNNAHSKLENKTWKSKVLEKAATCNPGIENKENILFESNLPYTNMLSNLLAVNLLKRRYDFPEPNEVEVKVSSSEEVIILDENSSSSGMIQNQIMDSQASNYSLELNYLRGKYLSTLKRKYSKSLNPLVPYSSKTSSFVDSCRRKSSDSQIVRKWVNTAFSTNEPNGISQREAPNSFTSDMKMHNKELPKLTAEVPPPPVLLQPLHGVPVTAEEEYSPCGRESEESFSLYYSKAADLASPLLDMKRFIYPDHIHYSYKHVKKKGFDVNINGGLPLLVRESLTMNNPIGVRHTNTLQNPELKIIRRPMDLSFASTNSWQSTDPNETGIKFEAQKIDEVPRNKRDKKNCETARERKNKKGKKAKKEAQPNSGNARCDAWKKVKQRMHQKTVSDFLKFTEKDHLLVEKLFKMYKKLHCKKTVNIQAETPDQDRPPLQISSTQLHSNKGKVITANYNPALVLNENKTKNQKRKIEAREERTKNMFARLEREVLFQNKNHQISFGTSKHT